MNDITVRRNGSVFLDGAYAGYVQGEPRDWGFMLPAGMDEGRMRLRGWHSKREAAEMCVSAYLAVPRYQFGEASPDPCPVCGGEVLYQFGNWFCGGYDNPECGWSTARDIGGPNGGRVTGEHCPDCGGRVIYNGNYFCEHWDVTCRWALPEAPRRKADRELRLRLTGDR
jgi:hypothetical protein